MEGDRTDVVHAKAEGGTLGANQAIDAQPLGLSDDVNGLRAAILSGRLSCEVDLIIDSLLRNVSVHFRSEDAIYVAAGFLGSAMHAAPHRQLVNRAAALNVLYRADKSGIAALFQFLAAKLLSGAPSGADQEFVPALEGQG